MSRFTRVQELPVPSRVEGNTTLWKGTLSYKKVTPNITERLGKNSMKSREKLLSSEVHNQYSIYFLDKEPRNSDSTDYFVENNWLS
jgi:hypothetical protein